MPDIAFGLRVNEAKAGAIVMDLKRAGLIDSSDDETFHIHNWEGRQRVSDNVSERVAKHRAGNGNVTLHETGSDRAGNNIETPPRVRVTETEQKQSRTETEQGDTPLPPADVDPPPVGTHEQRFNRFWSAYPRRTGKDAAHRWWTKNKPDDGLLAEMLAAIEAQRASSQWLKDGGQFIPNPATWLNQGRWKDDPEPDVPPGNVMRISPRTPAPQDRQRQDIDAFFARKRARSRDDPNVIEIAGRPR